MEGGEGGREGGGTQEENKLKCNCIMSTYTIHNYT